MGPRRLRLALVVAAALTVVAVILLASGPGPLARGRPGEMSAPVPTPEPPDAQAARPAPSAAEPAVPPLPPPPGARLLGRVTDDEGRPIPDARIWLTEGTDPAIGQEVARTGAEGRYVVDGVTGDERLVGAIAAGHAPSDLRRIRPAARAVFEIDFALRRGGGSLALAFEQSPAGVEVRIVPEPVVGVDGYEPGGARLLRTTGEGRLVADGLEPEWNYLEVRAQGFAPVFLAVRLPPDGTVDVRVPLARGATVSGCVRRQDGSPAAGAVVRATRWEWGVPPVAADAQGEFRIEHLPPVTVEVWARGSDGEEARKLFQLADGEEQRWDPVLRPPQPIAGRVVDAGGVPQAHARVALSSANGWGGEEDGETGADGSFRFDRLPGGEFTVEVWRPSSDGPPAAAVTAVPGGPPLTIILPAAEGGLRGTVSTGDGAPAAGTRVRAWPAGRPDREARVRTAADGSFLLPLPAGTYSVELHLDGEPTLHLDGVGVLAGHILDLGVLRFPAGGRVRARVLDPNGLAVAGAPVFVTSLDGSITYVVNPVDDAFVSEELTPGRYLVWGPDGIVEEAEVASGEVASVDLRARDGAVLEVRPLRDDGSHVMAMVLVEDTRGRLVATTWGPSMLLREKLASGTYRVTATDEAGRTASADVQIPAGGDAVQMVLVLR